jgi:hypothetical protein
MAAPEGSPYAGDAMLEAGILLLSVVCFVVLDLYVRGCEKI